MGNGHVGSAQSSPPKPNTFLCLTDVFACKFARKDFNYVKVTCPATLMDAQKMPKNLENQYIQ